jgi:hypothetical protein
MIWGFPLFFKKKNEKVRRKDRKVKIHSVVPEVEKTNKTTSKTIERLYDSTK